MGSKIFYRCFEVDDAGGFAAGKPVPAAQRAKTSIPIHPRGLSARRIDVYPQKVPARPEAKSALQGRGTGLARWWGHEVLKGPNTLTGVRAHRLGMQQRKLKSSYSCSCHTLSCCLPVLRSIGCRRCPHHHPCGWSPAPHRADFGSVPITSSVLLGP